MATIPEDQQKLQRLSDLLARAGRRELGQLPEEDLRDLPRLYRFASSLYARLETQGNDPGTLDRARELLRRSHAVLYRGATRDQRPWYRKLEHVLMVESPRALRAEWRLFAFMMSFFYGLAVVSYVAVSQHLELAFTLLDSNSVAHEIAQLQATKPGVPFQGNFTFGFGDSPEIAGWIMAHNMGASVLFFASGLAAPFFFYVLSTNALMVGTYTAVAAHWGQATAISSLLWCHGTLELQAIVIAGLGGLVMARAWVAPGSWSREHAMKLESRRALYVLAPAFPMLFAAGLIEAFITPHAPVGMRMAIAVVTGLAFLAWLFLAGREQTVAAAPSQEHGADIG